MKNLLTALLLLLSLTACKERQDENKLPEATQKGANTGGALVDGEIWVAKTEYPNMNNGGIDATYYKSVGGQYGGQISLRKSLGGIYSSRITILFQDTTDITTKTYILSNINHASGNYSYSASNFYSTDNQNTGFLTITKFDKKNQIIAGTFSFKAKNEKGETVTITDGRFDKKFFIH